MRGGVPNTSLQSGRARNDEVSKPASNNYMAAVCRKTCGAHGQVLGQNGLHLIRTQTPVSSIREQ
jgi:hypothetical protein